MLRRRTALVAREVWRKRGKVGLIAARPMFSLVARRETVAIPPSLFGMDLRLAVLRVLEARYANRLVAGVGVCLFVFDLTKVGECGVPAGSGAAVTSVEFRLVVFRPSVGEVLQCTVTSCDAEE